MKLLIIITRDNREFDRFWGYTQTQSLQKEALEGINQKIILIKPKEGFDISENIEQTSEALSGLCNNLTKTTIGIIFHRVNGTLIANSLKPEIEKELNSKLAFCDWYSSTKIDFWLENDTDEDLPYNNLKKAWKDSSGDKEKTFEAVWDYFLGDKTLENLLQPFAGTSPFDITSPDNTNLKEAKKKLHQYVDTLIQQNT